MTSSPVTIKIEPEDISNDNINNLDSIHEFTSIKSEPPDTTETFEFVNTDIKTEYFEIKDEYDDDNEIDKLCSQEIEIKVDVDARQTYIFDNNDETKNSSLIKRVYCKSSSKRSKKELVAVGEPNPYVYIKQYCSGCKKSVTRLKTELKRVCKKCKTTLMYECGICSRHYNAIRIIYRHLKAKDCQIKKDLKCSQCNYTTINKGHMKSHISMKHSSKLNKPWICMNCGKTFKRKFYVQKHKNSCFTDIHIYCNLCDFRTLRKTNYRLHMNRHHTLRADSEIELVDENSKVVDPLEESSRSSFESDCDWELKCTQESKIIDLDCNSLHKLFCYKCKKSSTVKEQTNLKCSECNVELLHECSLCSSKFNTYQNYLRHLQDRHAEKKPPDVYICTKCGCQFSNLKKLQNHEEFCNSSFFETIVPSLDVG